MILWQWRPFKALNVKVCVCHNRLLLLIKACMCLRWGMAEKVRDYHHAVLSGCCECGLSWGESPGRPVGWRLTSAALLPCWIWWFQEKSRVATIRGCRRMGKEMKTGKIHFLRSLGTRSLASGHKWLFNWFERCVWLCSVHSNPRSN